MEKRFKKEKPTEDAYERLRKMAKRTKFPGVRVRFYNRPRPIQIPAQSDSQKK